MAAIPHAARRMRTFAGAAAPPGHGGQRGASAQCAVCVRAAAAGRTGAGRSRDPGRTACAWRAARPRLRPCPCAPAPPQPAMHVQPSRTRLLLAQPRSTHTRDTRHRSLHRRLPRRRSGRSRRGGAAARPPRLGCIAALPAWRGARRPGTCCAAAHGQAAAGHSAARGWGRGTRGIPAVVVPGNDLQCAREAHAAAAPATAAAAAAPAPARAALKRACAPLPARSNQLPSPAAPVYESGLLLTKAFPASQPLGR